MYFDGFNYNKMQHRHRYIKKKKYLNKKCQYEY